MNNKVVLGLSGGVDSSVAVLLLKQQGYEVVGVFMKNFSDTKNEFGECNWVDERKSAQKIASILNIPFLTIDNENEYKSKVIKEMFSDYKRGLTPNPDILCNKVIKFPALLKKAKELGADFIATGHYARIKKTSKEFKLLTGKDKSKDQSYFLYELGQKELSEIIFPVGELTKSEVRKIAKKNKLPNWDKKGTSGVCFVGNIDFKGFLRNKVREKKGNVFSPEGKVIGTHPGAFFFTIGERVGEGKGILIEKDYRNKHHGKIYVAAKKANSLVVAPENHLLLKRKEVTIKNIHFISGKTILGKFKARIRHLGKLHSGTLKKFSNKFKFVFNSGVEGIAEGQHIVFYRGQEVVGGGEMRFK